jgi:hypothetical protein
VISLASEWWAKQACCPPCRAAGLSDSGFWSAADSTNGPPLTWFCYRCKTFREAMVR